MKKKAFSESLYSPAGWKKVKVMEDKTKICNRKDVTWEIRDSSDFGTNCAEQLVDNFYPTTPYDWSSVQVNSHFGVPGFEEEE